MQRYAAKRLSEVCRRTVWFHVPNGENRDPITAARLRLMGVRPGVADLIILSDKRPIAIELKTANGGRQSDNQKDFERAWTAAGGEYFIARSVQDIEGLIFRLALD